MAGDALDSVTGNEVMAAQPAHGLHQRSSHRVRGEQQPHPGSGERSGERKEGDAEHSPVEAIRPEQGRGAFDELRP